MKPETLDFKFLHVEPVLAVSDIAKTVSYWHDVLGFSDKWTWGDPPNHGGVSFQGAAFVQFSLDPELAGSAKGNSVWIRVKHLESLYAFHQKNASIVAPMEDKPWGFAEYTVKEINGYYIHFSAPSSERRKIKESFPSDVRIIERAPSITEYKKLVTSVGWEAAPDDAIQRQLSSAVYTITAEDITTQQSIGCAFLMGDNLSFYYVKDVIIHPEWQRKQIGTSLMKSLMSWLEKNASPNATVGLFTGDHLSPFYRQFGFAQACGMYRQVGR